MNNEYGWIWKEAVVSPLKKISLHFLLRTEDNEEKLRIIGFPAEVRKRCLVNTVPKALPLEPICRVMKAPLDG